MSDRCKNWTPGVPPAGLNGADLDSATVANAALAGSITNAKLAGSITSDKLSKPYALSYLTVRQETPAAVTGLMAFSPSQACDVLFVQAAYTTSPSSGATAVDCHVGASYGSHHTIFSGAKVAPGLTSLKTATVAAHGALGAVAAGGYVRVDVDSVASGTKAGLVVTLALKNLLHA